MCSDVLFEMVYRRLTFGLALRRFLAPPLRIRLLIYVTSEPFTFTLARTRRSTHLCRSFFSLSCMEHIYVRFPGAHAQKSQTTSVVTPLRYTSFARELCVARGAQLRNEWHRENIFMYESKICVLPLSCYHWNLLRMAPLK